jgi:ATP-dependent DNA helicase RecQ
VEFDCGVAPDPESLPNPLDEIARRELGVDYLFPYQKLVVSNILEGRDQIVILPTGAGKSLCFQFPAKLLPGVTVIVFPLISLITDQRRRLEDQGIRCETLKGGQSSRERREIWEGIRRMETKVLLTTPEALLAARAIKELRSLCISHLVVDEAHCVSEWGDSFRPAYLQLGQVPKEVGIPLLTAFTATASPRVLARVREVLFANETVNLVRANPDRPNISYTVLPSLSKEHTVTELVREVERPAIVFCRTRASTEQTSRMLRERLEDPRIRFYHAGLSKPERRLIEEWFFTSPDGVLTATCAYGMGVDKSDIRTVIHRDTPPSVEAFLQESGRGGRDRRPARSYLIVSREDSEATRRLPDATARERYEALLRFATDSRRCRRENLLELLDAAPEFCFGCDVCDGSVVDRPEGLDLIVEFVRHHPRRYTTRDLKILLAGRKALDARLRGLDLSPYFGSLSSWEPDDIETAVAELAHTGILHLPRRGPWKHRVTFGGRHGRRP